MKTRVIDLTVIAILTVVIFVQEQALSFLPNIQLTVLLFILYSRLLGTKKTLIIVLLHTFADNIYVGSLSPFLVIPMLLAWSLIPILLNTVFKRLKSPIFLTMFAFFFGFIYGMMFIPFVSYQFGFDPLKYYLADLPFELVMGLSGAVSVAILYEPLMIFFKKQPVFDDTGYLKRTYGFKKRA